jgi:hypothetical protein
MRYTQILALSALGMFLATAAPSGNAAVDRGQAVAVVNGTPISRDVWNLVREDAPWRQDAGDLTPRSRKRPSTN